MTIDYNLNEAILSEHAPLFRVIAQNIQNGCSSVEFGERYKGVADQLGINRIELLAYIMEHSRRVMEHPRREQS
jgi:hypothetical protein